MTKLLEKYSQHKSGARFIKIILALTLMPALFLRAIVLDLLAEKRKTL